MSNPDDIDTDVDGTYPENRLGIVCAECTCPLELHQPDPERLERLLGTCPECGLWHVIRVEVEAIEAAPPREVTALRAHSAARPVRTPHVAAQPVPASPT